MSGKIENRPIDLTKQPLACFDLEKVGVELLNSEHFAQRGLAGSTLVRDDQLTIIVENMRAGEKLRQHRSPASAMALLLSGKVQFQADTDHKCTTMTPGTLVTFAANLQHELVAEIDSQCLIVIGGRDR